MKKVVLLAFVILLAVSNFASADVVVNDTLVFGDGSRQSSDMQGPVGLQGPVGPPGPGLAGPQGPKGVNGTVTPASICSAIVASGKPLPTFCPTTMTDPTTGMVFHKVTGGTFTMGSDTIVDISAFINESPTHQVTVGDFYIGRFEVTQGDWKKVMAGIPPSYFDGCGEDCPVERVSWDAVQIFISTLNTMSGTNYRLPTEAEWEYAARSGGLNLKYSGGNDVSTVAWYSTNSGGMTHAAGQKRANGLGLYDMSGNVWEWVSDWYGGYSDAAQVNPTGPKSGFYRTIRGGSYAAVTPYVRAFTRYPRPSSARDNDVGFRLVAPVPVP
ncbi:MAG: formylglycine-generating enzyme family protein [Desulfuromonadaceae bacterium]